MAVHSSLIRLVLLLTISISSLDSALGVKCYFCDDITGKPDNPSNPPCSGSKDTWKTEVCPIVEGICSSMETTGTKNGKPFTQMTRNCGLGEKGCTNETVRYLRQGNDSPGGKKDSAPETCHCNGDLCNDNAAKSGSSSSEGKERKEGSSGMIKPCLLLLGAVGGVVTAATVGGNWPLLL